MCDPVTGTLAAATVLKIGSAVIEHKAQNNAYDANKASALDALKIQDHELSLREVEERMAGAQQIQQGDRQVATTQGDVRTNAAANGVSGMTVDMLLNDATRQGAEYKQSVDANMESSVDQLERDKVSAEAEAQSRINGVARANPLLTGLKIAGAGLDFVSAKIGQRPKVF